jgi:hypothetical protein
MRAENPAIKDYAGCAGMYDGEIYNFHSYSPSTRLKIASTLPNCRV